MDNDKYKRMCLNILENLVWYKPITFEIVDAFVLDFYRLVDDAFHNGIIKKKHGNIYAPSHPRSSTFYCLPKLHKPGPTIKGRLLISGSGNLTESVSKLIDGALKPHVETLFSM